MLLALSKVSGLEWKRHQLRELRMTNGCQTCWFPLLGRGGLEQGWELTSLGACHWQTRRHIGQPDSPGESSINASARNIRENQVLQ